MNNKENITNKFLNFEPEVDDEIIDKSWEKIKYFVPQKEKKKRGIIFFMFGAGALLLICFSLAALYYLPSTTVVSDNVGERGMVTENQELATNSMENNVVKPNEKIQNSGKIDVQQEDRTNSTSKIQHNTKVSTHISKEENSIQKDKNVILSTKQTSTSVEQQYLIAGDSISYDQLQQVPFSFSINNNNPELFPAVTNNLYFPRFVSPFSVDLFGGLQQSHNQTTQFGVLQKDNALNFLAGAAINYHLKNRFSLTGQFSFGKNNLNYNYTITENKIVKQVFNISSSPTSLQADTIRYINAFTNYKIRSQNSYYFSFGAEYIFLRKNKFSLGAFSLLGLCITDYKYGYNREYGTEIFVYAKGDPNNPADKLVSSQFIEGEQFETESRINTTLMPGIIMKYRLNYKTSIIFKPAYLIDLSENKIIINSSAFRLKQKGVLLNVGLRFNL